LGFGQLGFGKPGYGQLGFGQLGIGQLGCGKSSFGQLGVGRLSRSGGRFLAGGAAGAAPGADTAAAFAARTPGRMERPGLPVRSSPTRAGRTFARHALTLSRRSLPAACPPAPGMLPDSHPASQQPASSPQASSPPVARLAGFGVCSRRCGRAAVAGARVADAWRDHGRRHQQQSPEAALGNKSVQRGIPVFIS